MDIELGNHPQESVYITEQITALYNFLVVKYPGVVGSEFLRDSIPREVSCGRGGVSAVRPIECRIFMFQKLILSR